MRNVPTYGWEVTEQYVWDLRYIDTPIYRHRADVLGQSLDELLYYTTDANMNVTALVNGDPTYGGDVEERYTYDPYGKVTIYDDDWSETRSVSDVDNRILFAGYHYDPETGLYKARNRDLHPLLGRWTTNDPIGYADGLNLYQYILSNPTGYVDPFGLKTVKELQKEVAELNKEMLAHSKASHRLNKLAADLLASSEELRLQSWTPGLTGDERQEFLALSRRNFALARAAIFHADVRLDMMMAASLKSARAKNELIDKQNTACEKLREWVEDNLGMSYGYPASTYIDPDTDLDYEYVVTLDKPLPNRIYDMLQAMSIGVTSDETVQDVFGTHISAEQTTSEVDGSDVAQNPGASAKAGAAVLGAGVLAKALEEMAYGIDRVQLVSWVEGSCDGFVVRQLGAPGEPALEKNQARALLLGWCNVDIGD